MTEGRRAMGIIDVGVLVEYVGREGDPVSQNLTFSVRDPDGSERTFPPNPQYDNRRVEVFHSEAHAVEFMRSQRRNRRSPYLYRICTDLMTGAEKARFTKVIKEHLEPLESRIKALEARLGPAE